MKRARLLDLLGSLSVLAALVGLWALVAERQWISRVFLPSPQATLASLVDGLTHGALAAQAAATLGRMLVGWLLASLAGVLLGTLIGSSGRAHQWLAPMLDWLRPLPASAVLPLAIALFGLSPTMVLAVVAFGAMWPVLLSTLHGLASVHQRLREVASALQLSPRAFLTTIALPHALPDILAGMRLALTVSLIVSVVGEMLASQSGLGQAVLLAARAFQASELYAGVALLGAIGLASNALLVQAEAQLLRWQKP